MRAFRLLRILVVLELAAIALVSIPERESFESSGKFLVYSDGRYWWVDGNGRVIGTADPLNAATRAVLGCVDFDGMKIPSEAIETTRNLLTRDDVSEVCYEEKLVILRKGVMVYFQKWGDLEDYIDDLTRMLPYVVPRSVFTLYSGGDLLILKGGLRWQDTKYTSP